MSKTHFSLPGAGFRTEKINQRALCGFQHHKHELSDFFVFSDLTMVGLMSYRGCWNFRTVRGGFVYLLKVVSSGDWPYPPLVRLASRTPAYHPSSNGITVSTPCEAVSSGEITAFVPNSVELCMYERAYEPGMGPCHPRVPLGSTNTSQPSINQWNWGFHTLRGRILGRFPFSAFVRKSLEFYMYGNIYDAGMGSYPRMQLASRVP